MENCRSFTSIVRPNINSFMTSGNADERTNVLIEKEFENALAKGLRPCTPSILCNDKINERLNRSQVQEDE